MYKKIIVLLLFFLAFGIYFYRFSHDSYLKVIAIANYGPHSSLQSAIKGFKEEMNKEGYSEDINIEYEIADVGFDAALIPQMLSSLIAKKPSLMMVMTTPIAQAAKNKIKNIPLIFNVITDPVEAGLLNDPYLPQENMTGSSDKQDIISLLQFAKELLPHAKRVGILYSTSESNDHALVKMMQKGTESLNMTLVAIPIEQARDVHIRVMDFKDKVDFIYVGTSGPIQPTLPTIAALASKMNIPVINVEEQAVFDGLALASFGVDYLEVGKNAARLAASVLKGEDIINLKPLYPTLNQHYSVVNKKLAIKFNAHIPKSSKVVE